MYVRTSYILVSRTRIQYSIRQFRLKKRILKLVNLELLLSMIFWWLIHRIRIFLKWFNCFQKKCLWKMLLKMRKAKFSARCWISFKACFPTQRWSKLLRSIKTWAQTIWKLNLSTFWKRSPPLMITSNWPWYHTEQPNFCWAFTMTSNN